MNYYILVFDRKSNVDYNPFHDMLVVHPKIQYWWHYLTSAYIIGTNMSADELSTYARQCFEAFGMSSTHLVMKVDLANRQGMLTEDAWKWLRTNSNA